MATNQKTEATQPSQPGNKPVTSFKAKGIKVSVFENVSEKDGKQHRFFKVSMQKFYRDGEDWKVTLGLSRDDLPVAQHLLHKAWEWILQAESNKSSEEQDIPMQIS